MCEYNVCVHPPSKLFGCHGFHLLEAAIRHLQQTVDVVYFESEETWCSYKHTIKHSKHDQTRALYYFYFIIWIHYTFLYA